MKNSLMVAAVAPLVLVTLLAGCASGSAPNASIQKPDADGRYLIERDASGTPIRQLTLPDLESCQGALYASLNHARLLSLAGLPSNKYRCEQFGVFGLRYRGEFSCDDCEIHVSIAARTMRECEIAIETTKSSYETLLADFASKEGISMDHPDFQKALDELFKITECQLH